MLCWCRVAYVYCALIGAAFFPEFVHNELEGRCRTLQDPVSDELTVCCVGKSITTERFWETIKF